MFGLAWLGNNREARAEPKKSDAVVKVKAELGKESADGITPVHLTLTIDQGWHLYANPVGSEDLADNATTVIVGGGAKGEGVEYPEGKLVKDQTLGAYKIYEDQVKITVKTRRSSAKKPIELKIKIQSCNERSCLPPATIKVTVP
jgi:DsbC/DsbD-like thiol-disulfide interchange protein